MYQEVFQKLGLTVNEAKVYESLLTLGITTANKLALESKIQRRNVYDTVKQLKEKGLCSEIEEKGIRKFKAIHPNRLMDLLTEKESMLEQVMPNLVGKYDAIEPVEQTIVYKGIESVKNMYWDVIKQEEDLWVLGGRGNWLDPRLRFFLPKFDEERLKKRIRFRHLFYYELRDSKNPNHKITTMLKNNDVRFLPKGFTSTCSIEIYGDRVASMYWGEEPLVVVIISKQIAEGYKKYFEFMWNNCKP
ncbi:MAG: helix-turn-helix domain-containing protein [Candidatus Woesearchaeota archaeon]|jgi:predicted transcriptional regulator